MPCIVAGAAARDRSGRHVCGIDEQHVVAVEIDVDGLQPGRVRGDVRRRERVAAARREHRLQAHRREVDGGVVRRLRVRPGEGDLLMDGEVDGFIGPRSLSCFDKGHPDVGRLFANLIESATDYYKRTKIFPVMHLLGVRRRLADEHPGLPAALLKAFTQSKDHAVAMVDEVAASHITLPFLAERVESARDLLGRDFWSYGRGANVVGLENFLHHHHRQGLSQRLVAVKELFHPGAMAQFAL